MDHHTKSKNLDSRSITELEIDKEWEVPSENISGQKYKMKRIGNCGND